MVIVALDHGQQIASQHLKHHAHVATVRPHVVEAVHELHGAAVGVQLASGGRVRQGKQNNDESMTSTRNALMSCHCARAAGDRAGVAFAMYEGGSLWPTAKCKVWTPRLSASAT